MTEKETKIKTWLHKLHLPFQQTKLTWAVVLPTYELLPSQITKLTQCTATHTNKTSRKTEAKLTVQMLTGGRHWNHCLTTDQLLQQSASDHETRLSTSVKNNIVNMSHACIKLHYINMRSSTEGLDSSIRADYTTQHSGSLQCYSVMS